MPLTPPAMTVTLANPGACPCACPPPPPLPCPDCGGGFPLSRSVIAVPPAFEQHNFASAYGVMTLEGDLVFRLGGRDPADFDAMYPNPEFGGDLRANDAYSLVRTVVGTSVGWSLQGPGGQAPILNFVSASHLPGGSAANDGQAVHLRLVWDSAAGTVTGYVTYPGQPERMVGRFTGQWTPYQSAACLHTWYLGGGRYIGGGDLAAENLTESCGGGALMRPAAARSAVPTPVPLPCVHEGHTRPGPNGPDGKTYLGCDAGMGDPPGVVCRCHCNPACARYEADA